MESCLRKRSSADLQDSNLSVTVHKGRGRGCGRRRGRVLCDVASVVRKDSEQSAAGRADSSGSDLFVQAGPVHVWQEVAVSVRMRSTDPAGLSRRLRNNDKSTLG